MSGLPTRVLRGLRIALAIAFVAIVSGIPQVAYAALADDCCAERCESDRDERGCPPNCPSPSCVKVFPSAISPPCFEGVTALARQESRVASVVAPVLPLVSSGVFHPPRG